MTKSAQQKTCGVSQEDFQTIAKAIADHYKTKVEAEKIVFLDVMNIAKKDFPDLFEAVLKLKTGGSLNISFQGDLFIPDRELQPHYAISTINMLPALIQESINKLDLRIKANKRSGELREIGLPDFRSTDLVVLKDFSSKVENAIKNYYDRVTK